MPCSERPPPPRSAKTSGRSTGCVAAAAAAAACWYGSGGSFSSSIALRLRPRQTPAQRRSERGRRVGRPWRWPPIAWHAAGPDGTNGGSPRGGRRTAWLREGREQPGPSAGHGGAGDQRCTGRHRAALPRAWCGGPERWHLRAGEPRRGERGRVRHALGGGPWRLHAAARRVKPRGAAARPRGEVLQRRGRVVARHRGRRALAGGGCGGAAAAAGLRGSSAAEGGVRELLCRHAPAARPQEHGPVRPGGSTTYAQGEGGSRRNADCVVRSPIPLSKGPRFWRQSFSLVLVRCGLVGLEGAWRVLGGGGGRRRRRRLPLSFRRLGRQRRGVPLQRVVVPPARRHKALHVVLRARETTTGGGTWARLLCSTTGSTRA